MAHVPAAHQAESLVRKGIQTDANEFARKVLTKKNLNRHLFNYNIRTQKNAMDFSWMRVQSEVKVN
jgi:hypothetical protein